MAKEKGHIRQGRNVSPSRSPKSSESPDSFYEKYPLWSFKYCDMQHDKWSPYACRDIILDVVDKLKSLEGQRWQEILTDTTARRNNTRNHAIPISSLARDAIHRATEVIPMHETLYSLALASRLRLWGIMMAGVFHVVWIDREHEIYPVGK